MHLAYNVYAMHILIWIMMIIRENELSRKCLKKNSYVLYENTDLYRVGKKYLF